VTLKIADFGLSRSIRHSQSRRDTSSGGAGTDCWMPPEGLNVSFTVFTQISLWEA
jgi:serine/threonine protein kinase